MVWRVPTSLFCTWCPVSPITYEKIILSLWNSWNSCWKISRSQIKVYFCTLSFTTLIIISGLLSIQHGLDYCVRYHYKKIPVKFNLRMKTFPLAHIFWDFGPWPLSQWLFGLQEGSSSWWKHMTEKSCSSHTDQEAKREKKKTG